MYKNNNTFFGKVISHHPLKNNLRHVYKSYSVSKHHLSLNYFGYLLVSIGIIITVFLLSLNRVWLASKPLPYVDVSLTEGHSASIQKISSSYNSKIGGYDILVTGKATGDNVESYLILFRRDKPGIFKQKIQTVMNNDGTFQARHHVRDELKYSLGLIVAWSIENGKVVAISSSNFRDFEGELN